jgi:hypothetical protein
MEEETLAFSNNRKLYIYILDINFCETRTERSVEVFMGRQT